MTERAYTVKEVEALRDACKWKLACGRYSGPVGAAGLTPSTQAGGTKIYGPNWEAYLSPPVADVEEMVRTCMLAGFTAQELHEADL